LEEALALITSPKPFVIAVSDTLRTYLEEALALRAPERTTEEFLADLKSSSQLNASQKEQLADFLRQCDMVKFAKHEPRDTELRTLHSSALDLVAQTEPQAEGPPASPTQKTTLGDEGSFSQSSIVNRQS
jgi:hypothetical protein